MKKILSVMLIGLAIFAIAFNDSAVAAEAVAADTANGAKVFTANCAACHMGGRNVVQADKTLKKDALEKYNTYSLAAIIAQVHDGKNAMPAFKGRLSDKQIEDVAAYVLEKAEKGWS